jgi:hypothetical protein
MHHAGWKTALAALTLCASLTAAGEEPGVLFSRGDWEVACDNTRTCRIAGYCSEEDIRNEYDCAAVLIVRAAGPDTPIKAEMDQGEWEDGFVFTMMLRINGKSWGALEWEEEGGKRLLTPRQIRALLAAARGNGKIMFEGDDKFFALSGKGFSAVLRKADELQGRIGTPGAFLLKGKKPETSVLPPLAAPVIRAAKVSAAPSEALSADEVAVLKPLLWENGGQDCDPLVVQSGEQFTLTPLDAEHVLISTPCWADDLDVGNAYWVMDSARKGKPEFVTREAKYYEKGTLFGSFATHEKEVCRYGLDWVWDGDKFRQGTRWHTGECRDLPNAGLLPTFVFEVVRDDETSLHPD